MMKKLFKRKKVRIASAVLLAAASAALVAAALRTQREAEGESVEKAGQVVSATEAATSLTNDKETLRLRHGVDTLLLIGTDRIEGKDGTSPEQGYSYNYDLADFLVLLVFDNNARTVTPIQINRDTMTQVPWIALNGGLGGYNTEQIAFAHTYGSGGEDSGENTALAVSKLLYDAPIDGYIAISMDAVPVINDLVGGVTIKCEDTLSRMGDEFVPGATVCLKGSTALKYLRYRDTELTESNLSRMRRHRTYIEAFIPQAKEAAGSDDSLLMRALEKIGDYLVSNMSGNELTESVSRTQEYEVLPIVTFDGEYALGEFAEFYADPDSVWQCVSDALCEKQTD